eukprot:TRINITY_DN22724_c0_g1_i1.p1 TRINITY_DN22724_c0_g1~~TRINITY_DN22724_c0_g1_i1.p1  ORF type:complete len:105 (-),score=5.08 TRINITY_DN22724_c0_g1_i1:185-499(-)
MQLQKEMICFVGKHLFLGKPPILYLRISAPDTPWNGGVFTLELKFSSEYPRNPPSVRFVSVIPFHPNGNLASSYMIKKSTRMEVFVQMFFKGNGHPILTYYLFL